jgi:enoyl-CoA hydratase/carnithine racemase
MSIKAPSVATFEYNDLGEALPQAVKSLEVDRQVRVVVLRGAGDQAFVSGADISQFDQVRDSLEVNQRDEAIGITESWAHTVAGNDVTWGEIIRKANIRMDG